MDVRSALRWATGQRGLPMGEAQGLLQHALGCDRLALLTEPGRPLGPAAAEQFRDHVARRLRGEPLAYITGRAPFLALELAVGPGVLVPRPETEELALLAIDLARAAAPSGQLADVCCGSGAIGLALAAALPGWKVALADQGEQACTAARENALRIGLDPLRVVVRRGDLLAPLADLAPFDLLTCNPPYIPSDQLDGLPADDLRRHEPRAALDGGPDGLDFYRRLAREAPPYLHPGAPMLLEIGHDQGETVPALLREDGRWEGIEVRKDLAGQNRIVVARAGRS